MGFEGVIKDLTLKDAVEQAQAMEIADKDSKALQGTKNLGYTKLWNLGQQYLVGNLSNSNILTTNVGRQTILLPNVNLLELLAEPLAKLDTLLSCVDQEGKQILRADRETLQCAFKLKSTLY